MSHRTLAAFAAILLVAVSAAYLLSAELRAREARISGIASAIDGDTIRVGAERIRLSGIDAPEMRQPCYVEAIRCGEYARSVLAGALQSGPVTCIPEGRDRYNRIVAHCSVPGIADLGERMIATGYAMRWPKYDPGCRYCAAENEARRNRIGLWVTTFDPPWEWRHDKARP